MRVRRMSDVSSWAKKTQGGGAPFRPAAREEAQAMNMYGKMMRRGAR